MALKFIDFAKQKFKHGRFKSLKEAIESEKLKDEFKSLMEQLKLNREKFIRERSPKIEIKELPKPKKRIILRVLKRMKREDKHIPLKISVPMIKKAIIGKIVDINDIIILKRIFIDLKKLDELKFL